MAIPSKKQQTIQKSKYTYDIFIAAAKQCEDLKTRFIAKNRRLYEYAKQVGWYYSYPWKKLSNEGLRNYVIYCYKDEVNKTIYVGLTNNLKKRDYGHRYSGAVCKYFAQKNIPKPEILMDKLSADEARKEEGNFVKLYNNQGWKVLNKAKTGEHSSSLGGNNEQLTYDVCFKLSKKYRTKSEFQKGDVSAYRKALDMGWLENWFSNVERKKWTREKCYQEARKYQTRSEFRIKNQSAYNSAWKNNWLIDYYWFVKSTRKPKWNEEKCYLAAKECMSKTDFARKYSSAYKVAIEKGWISNYTWFAKTSDMLSSKRKWTYEACRNLAQKYDTRWKFGKENSGAYHVCLKNHWLDSFDWLKCRKKWTYEDCQRIAKKYKTRWEFGKQNGSAYRACLKNHWMDSFDWFND